MFARVSIIEGSPERIDESIRLMRETTIPEGRKMQGFRGGYLLVDRKTGKQMIIALWETEADLNASTEAANRLWAQHVQAVTAQPPKVEVYEVAVKS